MVNDILQGDALTQLKTLPDESVDCCITSPPYWSLRDYKVEGQLGLEPTFNKYLDKLIEIFAEVKRVLKKTGTVWVVIGDTYHGNGTTNEHRNNKNKRSNIPLIRNSGIQDKSLVKIPQRFCIRMVDELGYINRNEIIWYKRNCMPSSAKDRFTVDFEYVYFFTKSPKYHFETQYEPLGDDNSLGRIKRCVWDIPTKPFSKAHFAVYPTTLIEPMILAGCPEFICTKCNTPRKLEYEETKLIMNSKGGFDTNCKSRTDDDPHKRLHSGVWSKGKPTVIRMPKFGGNKAIGYGNPVYSGKEWNPVLRQLKTMGVDKNLEYHGQAIKDYEGNDVQNASDVKRRCIESIKKRANSELVMTDCGCNKGFKPGICLDPFLGSGTTALVALQHGRQFIGIELNQDYINIAHERLAPYLMQTTLPLVSPPS